MWELAALPGSGLFCLGRRRAAGLHFAAQLLALMMMIVAALLGLPALLWTGIGLLVVRQLVAAVQCLRSRGEAASWGKLIAIGLVGLILARVLPVYVRESWIEAFKIPSASMVPNLQVGNHIYVNKRAAPQPGDIVVYTAGPERLDYVKRVIALGPAEVRVEGRDVFVNGKQLPHTPIAEPCTHSGNRRVQLGD